MRATYRFVAGVIVGLLAGCSGDPKRDSSPWESVETTTDDGEILIEKVSYRSEGLLVYGQICRPNEMGPHAALVLNHGGYQGLLGEWNGGSCAGLADLGYAVIESSYRGEDGSEGEIEICEGEVTDVLAMLEIAAAQPWVDPSRIAMLGISHGGCITLRAVQRGAPVLAAADLFGPTDWADLHAFWEAGIAASAPEAADYLELKGVIETALGGTPATAQAAYDARSPLLLGPLPAGVPVLMVHGTSDQIVPVTQSCALASAEGFESHHLDGAQSEVPAAPIGCPGLTWESVHPSPSWTGTRIFITYDGLGHNFDGNAGATLQSDVMSFLLTKLP